MPRTLENPDIINGTVTDEEITSFTMDLNSGNIYIVFDRKDADGNVIIGDASHMIETEEATLAINRASEIAADNGADVYAAIKQGLYEYLPGNGTIA